MLSLIKTDNMKNLSPAEIKTFTKNCNELLEYVEKYGLPSPSSVLIPEFQMAARITGIRSRPELLEIAKTLDKNKILFK